MMVMIWLACMIMMPLLPPVMAPTFWIASRMAGQKTWISSARFTPSFLIHHPVTSRFATPKMVVDMPMMATSRAVRDVISRMLQFRSGYSDKLWLS